MLLLSLPCCTTGEGVGAEGTSVTAGLESWAAGGTEQVGLFISSTGRLSPLGSGCNILKKKKKKKKQVNMQMHYHQNADTKVWDV